jgi:preprotein translocase subunit SecA
MCEQLRRCEALVPRIEERAGRLRGQGDAELRQAAASVQAMLSGVVLSWESVLPEAFALAGEACHRVTGERPVAVQLVAGAALHFGLVADVKDGEGRRIGILLAAMLNAFAGRAVHVVSGNDYLARRDAEWARPIGELVGLSVGLLAPAMDHPTRREVYRAGITYGSASEFSYDYLRDNLTWERSDVVQRGHDRAFIADIDSVLIDDGGAAYMIGAPAAGSGWPAEAARLARLLKPDLHYDIHPNTVTISLTDAGVRLIEDQLGRDILGRDASVLYEIRVALRAKDVYRRGKQYDVVDGRVVALGDETSTAGRKFSGPIQQALEAKENLPVSEASQNLARITARGYFRLYRQLAGSSGSAARASEELARMYGLDTVEIPTHRPVIRQEHDDRLFRTNAQLYDAVLAAVLDRHETGQPVIVAAASARAAEDVRRQLAGADIPCRVADGHDHQRDADAIAAAGHTGAVTVVTEPACRGSETVLDGVAVFGVGRHRSRRHDDRLRDLAGRKGVHGECAFFFSWEGLLEWEWPNANRAQLRDAPLPESFPETGHPEITATFEQAQQEYEANFITRLRQVITAHEEVWDDQCRAFYDLRRSIVHSDDPGAGFLDLVHAAVDELVADQDLARASADAIFSVVSKLYPTTLSRRRIGRGIDDATIVGVLHADAERAYHKRCTQLMEDSGLGPEIITKLQRMVLLDAYDQKWRRHLGDMEQLHHDISAHAREHADPTSEFRHAATDLFQRTQHDVRRHAVELFFRATLG